MVIPENFGNGELSWIIMNHHESSLFQEGSTGLFFSGSRLHISRMRPAQNQLLAPAGHCGRDAKLLRSWFSAAHFTRSWEHYGILWPYLPRKMIGCRTTEMFGVAEKSPWTIGKASKQMLNNSPPSKSVATGHAIVIQANVAIWRFRKHSSRIFQDVVSVGVEELHLQS